MISGRGMGPRLKPAYRHGASMARREKLSVPARIVVLAPPAGVAFALQRGRRELSQVTVSSGRDLRFDLTLLADRGADGSPRFSGEFVQGPTGRKFVYVNSGTLAGQAGSCWTMRAEGRLHVDKLHTDARLSPAAGDVSPPPS